MPRDGLARGLTVPPGSYSPDARTIEPKGRHRFAIPMSSAEPRRIPSDCRSCQERGGGHEGQDDGVGPCAANGAPGLGDHFGHAALGIGLSQAGSGHDHANKVGAILGGHVGVSEAGGDDPRGLRADIRLNRVVRAAIRAKQPVKFERQQRLGGCSARREGVAGGLRRCSRALHPRPVTLQ